MALSKKSAEECEITPETAAAGGLIVQDVFGVHSESESSEWATEILRAMLSARTSGSCEDA
jgi:hypothetical protein